MPLYMCSKCGSVDNTALGGFWGQQMRAIDAKERHVPLCSACDPSIGKWHEQFSRRAAGGYVQGDGGFIYTVEEATGRFKHLAPFRPVEVIQKNKEGGNAETEPQRVNQA